ncbi:endolytic transglycosylase MltG [Paenibacillus pasadenensis]|uniref:endolytic transglycosylase MltG n=1 Tax=Paenibacillus pasadenensis TaxID=217090 RepID=UPI002040C27D|nr:endolytic transglycosylase MltG [Paenibacillus pasadenensis]MCM3746639.1 endolytic transglycosylase MltG [Paenibacillus pasadenensis]
MDGYNQSGLDGQEPSGPARSRITLWVLLVLVSLLLLTAAGIGVYIWNGLRPAAAGEAKQVVIERGMSPFQVANQLEQDGIIRNSFIFKYYLKFKEQGGAFKAGTYQLSPGMEHDDIVAKLNSGDTVKEETIRFTIPEGFTVLQIADKLSAEGLVDRERFLELADQPRDWDADAVKSIPDDDRLRHRLEGYLFPDTYELKKGSSEEEILERMLVETDRKLAEFSELEEALAERKLTLHGLMTVASLVEREVVADKERPAVAGVIYNRLAKPMRLQIDATVQYLLDKPKERLYEKDLEVESPYNSYRSDGLPPGPISSPSLKSIEAALYPETNGFFYYVTKKDGSNEHLFAVTYDQHLKNIRESEKQ